MSYGPFHITFRLGVPSFDADELAETGEGFFDPINKVLRIAYDPAAVIAFAPVNSNSGMAFGFSSPDENYSVKAAYKIGAAWGTSSVPAIVNHNDPDTGIYFPKDAQNNPLGIGFSYGGQTHFQILSDKALFDKKVEGNNGAKFYGVVESDDFVLASINKVLDNNVDIINTFVYETRLDADKGGWRERTDHTSWANETSGAQRSSRKKFPSTAVLVARSDKLDIYDADDVNLSKWMSFSVGAARWLREAPTFVSAYNGIIVISTNSSIIMIDLLNDEGYYYNSNLTYRFSNTVAERNLSTSLIKISRRPVTGYRYQSENYNFGGASKVIPGPSSQTFYDPITGMPRNFLAAISLDLISILLPNREPIALGTDAGDKFFDIAFNNYGDLFGIIEGGDLEVFNHNLLNQNNLNENRILPPTYKYKKTSAVEHGINLGMLISGAGDTPKIAAINNLIAMAWEDDNFSMTICRLLENYGDRNRSMLSFQSNQHISGWMVGDCRAAWLANNITADRSRRATNLTQNGTVPSSLVNKSYVYGPFSSSNYLSIAYNADTVTLPGAEWSIMFHAKIPESANTQCIFELASSDSDEDFLRVEVDPNGILVLTHRMSSQTSEIVEITSESWTKVNTDEWSLFCIMKRGNNLLVSFNGVFIINASLMKTVSDGPDEPLNYVTFSNASAVLQIGKAVRSPNNVFKGQLALFRWSWTAPKNNQLEQILDWERILFQATNLEFFVHASATTPSSMDFDPITQTLLVGSDFGVHTFNRFIRTAHYATSNSNIPDNVVNYVSGAAGNLAVGTDGGTWVLFPPVSLRERVSSTISKLVTDRNNFVANAGGSYTDYQNGTNTVTETVIGVIHVEESNPVTVEIEVEVTNEANEIETGESVTEHICSGSVSVTNVDASRNSDQNGVNNLAYDNITPDYEAYVLRYEDLSGKWFQTWPGDYPDYSALYGTIEAFGEAHWEANGESEGRVLFPPVQEIEQDMECLESNDDAVAIRVDPIPETNTVEIVLEHPQDELYTISTSIRPAYSGLNRFDGDSLRIENFN